MPTHSSEGTDGQMVLIQSARIQYTHYMRNCVALIPIYGYDCTVLEISSLANWMPFSEACGVFTKTNRAHLKWLYYPGPFCMITS